MAMNLKSLSNINLLSHFVKLVQSERKITGQILEFVGEIDKRKLYAEKGYTSIYDYLIREFGYSHGAAMRRIDGARLLNEIPEVAEKFENGSLTLSQATQLQKASREFEKINNSVISSREKRALVSKIENSSQKETEQTIAKALDLPIIPVQKATFHKDESVTLTITLTQEQMSILKQAQNMISHCVSNKNWADAITYLAKKEVSRRSQIRPTTQEITAATAVKKENLTLDTSNLDASSINGESVDLLPNMHRSKKRAAIPLPIRKKLLHPNAKCEHTEPNGKRCLSSRFLQIDHIKSWSRGSEHSLENFQVLCGAHNRLKYKKEQRSCR